MSCLGLPEEQEQIYRLCRREPGIELDSLSDRLRLPPDSARQELRGLCELELLHRQTDGVVAADPDAAVARLLDLRLQGLRKMLRLLTQLQPLVASLRAERCERSAALVGGIEQVTELPKVCDRIDDLAFFAREEVALVEPGNALKPEEIEQVRPRVLRCLRRGLSVRTVFVRKAVDHPPTVAYLRELESDGARVRLIGHTAAKIEIYDRRTAVIPVHPENRARGALFAQESGLVSNLFALFESIWEKSSDLFALLEERKSDDDGPSEVERMVLRTMCSGRKDEAGARDLGVSVRTYRRHIADSMQMLGAGTRSQAALLARERGWI
ncbi:response regulator transcription factor [Streptomyces bathyalis]|uniref:Response regulator transcription factor n=2 Tax=Streptomyces bathyalis TaxID=2710756 RepID=A0A7T1TCN1_9ACTN|nr:response regulator transcription factor [Streptomyces bathyalis]